MHFFSRRHFSGFSYLCLFSSLSLPFILPQVLYPQKVKLRFPNRKPEYYRPWWSDVGLNGAVVNRAWYSLKEITWKVPLTDTSEFMTTTTCSFKYRVFFNYFDYFQKVVLHTVKSLCITPSLIATRLFGQAWKGFNMFLYLDKLNDCIIYYTTTALDDYLKR